MPVTGPVLLVFVFPSPFPLLRAVPKHRSLYKYALFVHAVLLYCVPVLGPWVRRDLSMVTSIISLLVWAARSGMVTATSLSAIILTVSGKGLESIPAGLWRLWDLCVIVMLALLALVNAAHVAHLSRRELPTITPPSIS